ncbi:pesticidal protein Cry7Aa [Olleya sp. HaHaR_3_96]|uniref:glycoside hydrolase family 130 protein n=1 Tax=Olleya sp. HaHaR_3_96 TaxID=2745560 RepID=UPI001C4F026C|nr:pesticidal protein Cry7Aa [Olleya sp. HaHaR_3_96]QXP58329.1 pesticidal protein Cry7Aa [Olleya sp. HaHaR_3_96]
MDLVIKHGILLEKTSNTFESLGVFNPAIIQEGNKVHVFYRAVRDGNFSTIGYCKLEGPLKVVERSKTPILYPETLEEFQGVEDPRISKIEDTYYLSYSAYDGTNVFGAFATSKNLKTFNRKGIITPRLTFEEYSKLIKKNFQKINRMHLVFYNFFNRYKLSNLIKNKIHVWDKNIVFFSKKINKKFAVLHRLYPSIQILYFDSPEELTKEFWEDYITNLQKHIVLSPKYKFENSHIGAGCPPIETKDGWLLIYHSAQLTHKEYTYHACAALLDLENPNKVIARLKNPLFSPTESYEKEGYVANVVFPTGTAIFNKELYIYYGAADSCVAVASININTLLTELKKSKNEKNNKR